MATGCGKRTTGTDTAPSHQRAELLGCFNSDSAYRYVAEQVACGPRVPGTSGHDRGRDHIINTLRRIGYDSMMIQRAHVTTYDGTELPMENIVVGYNLKNTRRILLTAHYDTRPWADQDADTSVRQQPIPGANDGGSGVGVLLEIARNLANKAPAVGVDLMFIDTEDCGDSSGFGDNTDSWCLGSKYWAQNIVPYNHGNKPIYGINLDMVGGRDAKFYYEAYSAQKAPTPTIKVWSEAAALGYDDIFINRIGGAVTDDHIPLTEAGIPTTDVIELNNPATSSFNPTWHTMDDDMDNIDPATLDAVGKTVLNVIYKEKAF